MVRGVSEGKGGCNMYVALYVLMNFMCLFHVLLLCAPPHSHPEAPPADVPPPLSYSLILSFSHPLILSISQSHLLTIPLPTRLII